MFLYENQEKPIFKIIRNSVPKKKVLKNDLQEEIEKKPIEIIKNDEKIEKEEKKPIEMTTEYFDFISKEINKLNVGDNINKINEKKKSNVVPNPIEKKESLPKKSRKSRKNTENTKESNTPVKKKRIKKVKKDESKKESTPLAVEKVPIEPINAIQNEKIFNNSPILKTQENKNNAFNAKAGKFPQTFNYNVPNINMSNNMKNRIAQMSQFNQFNQINQITQFNFINSINSFNNMNQINLANPTQSSGMNSIRLLNFFKNSNEMKESENLKQKNDNILTKKPTIDPIPTEIERENIMDEIDELNKEDEFYKIIGTSQPQFLPSPLNNKVINILDMNIEDFTGNNNFNNL